MILIIGKIPPPIGGVAIHTKRLLERLKAEGYEFDWFDLSNDKFLSLPMRMRRATITHLHTSHSYLRLGLILLSILLRRKLIFTFHGNVGRFGAFRNLVDRCAIRLAEKSILINANSFELARSITDKAVSMPAFIPPDAVIKPTDSIVDAVEEWRHHFTVLFSTNAHAFSIDKHGLEIYGILELLNIFASAPTKGLIIADPSGSYQRHIQTLGVYCPPNVLLISEPLDYVWLIQRCDCVIRSTTTDGDSLSVKEALFFGKPVIASDCVARPDGCQIYETGNVSALRDWILAFQPTSVQTEIKDGFISLSGLYQNYGCRAT